MHREKSAKMAIWQKNSHFAILALLSLCIDFKIFFCQMTSRWLLWKTYYTIFPKKCIWPCPGPSMYWSGSPDQNKQTIALSLHSTRSHFAKKHFEIGAQGQKCQNGKVAIFCQIAILALFSLCTNFKIFLTKWLLVECYERAITHFCWKSVSGPVQACPCTYLRG